MKTKERKGWQADPNSLKSDSGCVQYWNDNGTMITAQMTIDKARELVRIGRAFVVTDQAIGECVD